PFDCAVLVTTTAGAAADADHAYHLAIHDDGEAARVREEVVLRNGARLTCGVVPPLCVVDGRRHARLQRRLGFHQGGPDVVEHLAIHPLHVHELAEIVEDVERHAAALR